MKSLFNILLLLFVVFSAIGTFLKLNDSSQAGSMFFVLSSITLVGLFIIGYKKLFPKNRTA